MENKDFKLPIHPAKRIFDVFASLLMLVLLSPFILLVILSVITEHILRGRPSDPLLYKEIRMSQGKPFWLLKFNIFKYEEIISMREKGIFIHTKNLEKTGGVTFVGWLLKQIYMDELPQLLNVIQGNMSIVGPRPVNEEVYEALMSQGIVAKKEVKAGITGNFQSFKNTAGKKSDESDREYVDYYFNNPWYKILLFDLKIILRTMKVILRARGV
ncbi:MAG: hypothetical protein BMS9Abin13_141 [Patescibacteria group bacterium]|nr:MAG: hypothetical protein BMS9Abin13_141 [Patescibacteria group bacterium]